MYKTNLRTQTSSHIKECCTKYPNPPKKQQLGTRRISWIVVQISTQKLNPRLITTAAVWTSSHKLKLRRISKICVHNYPTHRRRRGAPAMPPTMNYETVTIIAMCFVEDNDAPPYFHTYFFH